MRPTAEHTGSQTPATGFETASSECQAGIATLKRFVAVAKGCFVWRFVVVVGRFSDWFVGFEVAGIVGKFFLLFLVR